MTDVTILVCTNYRYSIDQPSCRRKGAEQLLQALRAATKDTDIVVEAACCFGHCVEGAVVRIAPGGKFYHNVVLDDLPNIVEEAIRFANTKRES